MRTEIHDTHTVGHAQAVRPVAAKHPSHRVMHGDDVLDNYEWLRNRDDPEVLAYLEAQNAYAEARTEQLAGLRDTLYHEVESRTVETDMSVPYRAGSWWYFTRTTEGQEYWEQCRCPVVDVPGTQGRALADAQWTPPTIVPDERLPHEEVIFDANALAAKSEFFAVGSFDVSEDGNWLLYGLDTQGNERYELRIKNLVTGTLLDDVIENTAAGAAFSKDAAYIFYSTVDEAWRPDKIWRHNVNRAGVTSDVKRADVSPDVLILHEPDDRYWVGVGGLTRSREYFTLEVGSSVTSETLVAPANDSLAAFAPVWEREEGVEYDLTHARINGESRFIITHNRNAPNGETVVVSTDDPTTILFTLLPHSTERRIEGVSAFERFLLVDYREHGLTQAGVMMLDPTAEHGIAPLQQIPVDLPLYTISAGASEWEEPNLRLSVTSLSTPRTLYLYAVASGDRSILKRQVVNGDFDAEAYREARVWAPAEDGKRIPISLVWRPDGDEPLPHGRPTLLYGYGSYEASMDPGFSIARLSLLDRGVVFAIAHVRGGGELGRAWYDDGKVLTKRHTFTDFIDAARHLIELGCASPERLAARGGSAGGLLMGAVTNMAPELFCAVHAAVPFVDALTSILKPELPLTVIEWDEWGDPLHSAEVYNYMKTYTPYENVRGDVTYPKILATTSLNDTRVLCVEPAKWVARLTELGHDALLRIEMHAGHGGVSGKYARWRDSAWEDAWLLNELHATEPLTTKSLTTVQIPAERVDDH